MNLTRYLYTALGGGLVGLGGAAFTLAVSTTWLESAISGNGWIALAIVIFGGWHPWRVMGGVYLVAALRAIVTGMQTQVSRQLLELLNALGRNGFSVHDSKVLGMHGQGHGARQGCGHEAGQELFLHSSSVKEKVFRREMGPV